MSRVYLATTRAGLAGLHASGTLPRDAEPVLAEADDEESEYAALMTAASLSAALGGDGGRRVVVVAEGSGGAAPTGLADVVAVHCDTGDRAADADPDDDLAWFATQEVPDLLEDR